MKLLYERSAKFETLKAEGTEKVENEKKRFNETAQ